MDLQIKTILARIWKLLHLPKNLQLFIMRFANDQFLIGVTGVIFNDKNEILLFKHTYRQTEWSLPGGYLKATEKPKEGLMREIKEESGFDTEIIKIMSTKADRESARIDISCYGIYLGNKFQPNEEIKEYNFFPADNLPVLIKHQYHVINEALKRKKTYDTEHMSIPQRLLTKMGSLFRKN